MNMRLLGVRTIDELRPEMVDASALNQHIVPVPQDNLFQQTCGYRLPTDAADTDSAQTNHCKSQSSSCERSIR